jgi:hypothetical protein
MRALAVEYTRVNVEIEIEIEIEEVVADGTRCAFMAQVAVLNRPVKELKELTPGLSVARKDCGQLR